MLKQSTIFAGDSIKDCGYSEMLLNRFSQNWENRSRVRKHTLSTEDSFLEDKPDFLESLLPFGHHSEYLSLSDYQKRMILSYGWLAYNLKTIAIESKIVSPVCYNIIDGAIPGAADNSIRSTVAETLIDESYHILLCHHAMKITEKKRKINRNIMSEFDIVTQVQQLVTRYNEGWQKNLIVLATAIVSEIFISNYLEQLSNCHEIVPLNRETVKAHHMDELAHGRIFDILAKSIYSHLTQRQKNFFEMILPFPVQFFASKELKVWRNILNVVCPLKSKKIIQNSLEEEWYNLYNLDYTNLIKLTEEMGIHHFEDRLFSLKESANSYQLRSA